MLQLMLCSNRYMYDLFKRKCPLDVHVVVDGADIPGARTVDSYDPKRWIARHLTPAAFELVDNYQLYAKLILPLQLAITEWEDVLYHDDDVLCLRDWSYLPQPFFSANVLDRLRWDDLEDIALCDAIQDVFGMEWDPDINGQWSVDCGVSYWQQEDAAAILGRLIQFLENKKVQDFFTRHRHVNRGRMLDQRFLTPLVAELPYSFRITSRQDYMVIPYKFPSKYLSKPLKRWPTFVHYGASSHKPAWAEWLDRHATYDILHRS
jgi:hypothetical protein